ncbi:Mov34/MPN/PAD-1 [Novosphingobium marinum]|nr:M67 family metallopeptidase [Novosphingobium marinum]GGC35083.1 Mov34/MPN/PAD-1 [Novosphingobium marinum]
MPIEVTSKVVSRLVSEARNAAPEECCGLLLGRKDRITFVKPTANVAEDPVANFEIDPAALVKAHKAAREDGPEVIGYYHSHPEGRAIPSASDRASAARDGRIWAIVAGEDVKFWRDSESGFVAIQPLRAEH